MNLFSYSLQWCECQDRLGDNAIAICSIVRYLTLFEIMSSSHDICCWCVLYRFSTHVWHLAIKSTYKHFTISLGPFVQLSTFYLLSIKYRYISIHIDFYVDYIWNLRVIIYITWVCVQRHNFGNAPIHLKIFCSEIHFNFLTSYIEYLPI